MYVNISLAQIWDQAAQGAIIWALLTQFYCILDVYIHVGTTVYHVIYIFNTVTLLYASAYL